MEYFSFFTKKKAIKLCVTVQQTLFKMAILKDQKLVFKTNSRLMQVKSIAESKGSILQFFSKRNILQCFRPSLNYHLSLRSLFCLFLSGPLRQVLLYSKITCTVKPVLSGHLNIDKKKVIMEKDSLMEVESIAECSNILQYF